jgi:AAA+ ATPase superfamily predicted ATPase
MFFLDKLSQQHIKIEGRIGVIIGRSKQQKILERANQSKIAQLIMVYGRRRVGKTYLIGEFFKNR